MRTEATFAAIRPARRGVRCRSLLPALLLVYGNPLAETAVWRALADAGVPTVMLPLRGAGGGAVLGNGLATQLPLRRLQQRLADRPKAAALAMVRWQVRAKLQG